MWTTTGIDLVQEKILGQGPQDNESAVEQAKDEQISDFIRSQYKNTTGKDIPIKDKETRFSWRVLSGHHLQGLTYHLTD